MNRRGFLSLLSAGAAGLILDPERLLWVPGQKTIFLPSLRVPSMSMRYIGYWSVQTDQQPTKLDTFYGYGSLTLSSWVNEPQKWVNREQVTDWNN